MFLGILLDGRRKVLSLPQEKIIKARNWLKLLSCTGKKKATVQQLQSLAGLLNFLNRATFPGRVFTRRMFAKWSGSFKTLKPYHHIRLNGEFKKDCAIWLTFLGDNMIEAVACPFVDLTKQIWAREINFSSDAAAGEHLGYSCICGKSWSYGRWENGFIKKQNPSIEFLELYALCMGVFMWRHRLRNMRIAVECDNEAVVHMVNNSSSSCKYCMVLIRKLVLKCLLLNTRVFARHLKGIFNVLPDRLSRTN